MEFISLFLVSSFLYLAPPRLDESARLHENRWTTSNAFYDHVRFADGTEGNLVVLIPEERLNCAELIESVHHAGLWSTRTLDRRGARVAITFINSDPETSALHAPLHIPVNGLHGLNPSLKDEGRPLAALDYALPKESTVRWGLWGEITVRRHGPLLSGDVSAILNAGALRGRFDARPCPFFGLGSE